MENKLIRPVKFPAIDGIRFYAALAVFMQHVIGGAITEYFRIPAPQFGYHVGTFWMRVVAYFQDGDHGVDVFFIISGFLMARIVLADGRGFSYAQFLGNRVRRIYPAFLVSLVGASLADCLLFGWAWKPYDFLKDSVFLNAIPGYSVIPYNHVSWSLGFEFAFYLVIPVLLLASRLVDRRVAALVLVIAACAFTPDDFIRMKALFVGALIGSFSDDQLTSFASRIPFAVVIGLYLGCGILKAIYFDTYPDYYYCFIPLAAVAFVKVVWGNTPLTRFFSATPMRKLGTLSYSIYLYHSIVASAVLLYLTPRAPSVFGAAWYVAATAAITLLFSYASYMLVERRYFSAKRAVTHQPITA